LSTPKLQIGFTTADIFLRRDVKPVINIALRLSVFPTDRIWRQTPGRQVVSRSSSVPVSVGRVRRNRRSLSKFLAESSQRAKPPEEVRHKDLRVGETCMRPLATQGPSGATITRKIGQPSWDAPVFSQPIRSVPVIVLDQRHSRFWRRRRNLRQRPEAFKQFSGSTAVWPGDTRR